MSASSAQITADGGARDSCSRWRVGNDGASANKGECLDLSANCSGENATLAGTRAGELPQAGRQASQLLRCCGGECCCPSELSAEQIIANGSKPK